MDIQILNASVVILAERHNPTLLHPAFLKGEDIVEAEWTPEERGILCTPAFATVKFTNNISFTKEAQKLQVVEGLSSGNIEDSIVPDLAKRYIRKLPFVNYTAVGVNFLSVIPLEKADDLIIGRFLKDGAWSEIDSGLAAVGLRLVYKFDDTQMSLTIDPGEAVAAEDDTRHSGILLKANFNKVVDGIDEAVTAISMYSEWCQKFRDAVSMVLEGE